jgi:hypothetical protein
VLAVVGTSNQCVSSDVMLIEFGAGAMRCRNVLRQRRSPKIPEEKTPDLTARGLIRLVTAAHNRRAIVE